MELIIDANVLFSALLKDSVTSDLLFKNTLYAPEFIIEEFKKYKEELKKKTKRSEEDFIRFFQILENNITLIPKEALKPYIKKAEIISPDPKDVLYFALALKLKCAIWSQDKALKNQKSVVVYNTEELYNIFKF
ncbi:MAG: PIN domain-containing protein [Candidatus Woesearchaeota archaeon]